MSRADIRIILHMQAGETGKAHSMELSADRLATIEPERAEVLREQAALCRTRAGALARMLAAHPEVYVHTDPGQMVLFSDGGGE